MGEDVPMRYEGALRAEKAQRAARPEQDRESTPWEASRDYMAGQISRLDLAIENLQGRLAPVLMVSEPYASSEADERAIGSEVTDTLRGQADAIGALTERVQRLQDRLAV